MVKALVPLAAGIVLGERFVLPGWFVAAAFLSCGVVALLLRSSAAAVGMLVAAGWGVCLIHAPVRSVPKEIPCVWELEVEGIPADRGRYVAADATVRAWRTLSDEEWHPAADRVLLRADSSVTLPGGGHIRCFGRLRPLSGGSESYRALMARRGFAGTLYISSRDLLETESDAAPDLHLRAAARMKRLCSPGDAGAVVRAMTVADRSGVTPELRAAYSRSGMSHLLAVSGLHTGIVFLLVNIVSRWLVFFRHGHRWRNLLAVAAVWLYVAAAGFPPSAVRAAVMCSLLQWAVASGSVYAGMNAWAAAAFGMLLWNPAWIGDVGFQLSFVAVAAILLWAVPVCRRLRTRHRAVDAAVGTWVVGLAATLATAPLVSHTFGILPVAGLLLNPIVIPLAGVVVFCGLVGLFVPGLCRVGEGVAGLLNELARRAASLPAGAAEYTLSTGATIACYLFFVAATVWLWRPEAKKTVHLPS